MSNIQFSFSSSYLPQGSVNTPPSSKEISISPNQCGHCATSSSTLAAGGGNTTNHFSWSGEQPASFNIMVRQDPQRPTQGLSCGQNNRVSNSGVSDQEFDILSQALNGRNDGAATINDNAKSLLRRLAITMDNNQAIYGKPDSGSWLNEINEDSYLDKSETAAFSRAITAYLNGDKSLVGKNSETSTAVQNNSSESTTSNTSSYAQSGIPKQEYATLSTALTGRSDGTSTIKEDAKPLLRNLAIAMDNNSAIYGKPDSGSWLNEVNEDNYLDKSETAAFSRAITEYLNGNKTLGSTQGSNSAPAPSQDLAAVATTKPSINVSSHYGQTTMIATVTNGHMPTAAELLKSLVEDEVQASAVEKFEQKILNLFRQFFILTGLLRLFGNQGTGR
ncbi:MAG: hypothetical protein IT497_01310 [Ottowia sp.]|nr:hypothetical protein [Ottowia sp.]